MADVSYQSIIAVVIVLLAAAWLIRRMWQTVRRGIRGDSRGCGTCPNNKSASGNDGLVQLSKNLGKKSDQP